MIDFTNKVLVLMGANGGITRSIAEMFFELGANLVLTDINEEGLTRFAQSVDPSGQRVIALRQDARSSADADAVAAKTKDVFGACDFLVTGAGLYLDQLVEDMSDEQWAQTIGINQDGTFYTCRALMPLLREGGAIVNIASMAGHRGSFKHAHYAAAKGAVLAFTRSLAWELAPRGIRANAVSPGLIDTPLIQPLLAANGPALMKATPMGRLGTAREVASVVAFLCSDWAAFITGETIHVNGGLYIHS